MNAKKETKQTNTKKETNTKKAKNAKKKRKESKERKGEWIQRGTTYMSCYRLQPCQLSSDQALSGIRIEPAHDLRP